MKGTQLFSFTSPDSSSNVTVNTITATTGSFGDGSASAPSITFTADTNTGIYRIGTDQFAITAGGIAGLEVRKSTGNFANIGMGAAASTSDQYPLLISRVQTSVGVIAQVANATASANANAMFQVSTDSDNRGHMAVYTTASTVDPYISSLVVRAQGDTLHLTLHGGESASGDVRVYTGGGFDATYKAAVFNADKTMTSYGGVIVSTAGARPTAGVAYRGMLYVLQGAAGVTDKIQVCLKAVADTYSWVDIVNGG